MKRIELVRWYYAPDHPIAAKDASIQTYYGNGRPTMKVRATELILGHLERQHNLERRPAPIIGDP